MTREEGLHEIAEAKWKRQDGYLNLWVSDKDDNAIEATMEMRPPHCDRGHIMVKVFGLLVDNQDGFPRYFFWFDEADRHIRQFLRWRLWQVRGESLSVLRAFFEGEPEGCECHKELCQPDCPVHGEE